MRQSDRRAFTLLETAAVVGMVSLLLGVLAPAVKQARVSARGSVSAGNLAFIGQGTAMYALDHEGRLFSYTWRAGIHVMPDGKTKVSPDDWSASTWQQTEILMRRTGRISGPDRIVNFNTRLIHRRYTHLVLMDYLNVPFPSAQFADPLDANLLQWQANSTDTTAANNIPYAIDAKVPPGFDAPTGWNNPGARQRWAFGSSYQRTISAWGPDGIGGEPEVVPVPSTPHLTLIRGNVDIAAGRNFAEIAFPSAKVHFFEEFDRRQAGSPYFAYDHAAPLKVMFDGSINDRPSGEANPSWNSALGKQEWRQTYVPIHTFPIPLDGLGSTTLLSQRYRWTTGGLKGTDYNSAIMRR
jgi:type II secretory pathway pseudopilin PulG